VFRRRRGRPGRDEQLLLDEVEEFLAGRALLRYRGADPAMPVWVAANWLAHAEPSTIEERVRYETGLQRLGGSWEWAVSTLARELVALAGWRPEVVRQLQRDCFVPIELAVLERSRADMLPLHLVTLGLARLRTHPGVAP
jgi:hypothetical protein